MHLPGNLVIREPCSITTASNISNPYCSPLAGDTHTSHTYMCNAQHTPTHATHPHTTPRRTHTQSGGVTEGREGLTELLRDRWTLKTSQCHCHLARLMSELNVSQTLLEVSNRKCFAFNINVLFELTCLQIQGNISIINSIQCLYTNSTYVLLQYLVFSIWSTFFLIYYKIVHWPSNISSIYSSFYSISSIYFVFYL